MGVRKVWVRKPATPLYASTTRVAVRPGTPVSVMVTCRPPRSRCRTLTSSTVNASLPIVVVPTVSEKSRLPALQERSRPRLSTSAVVRSSSRDQRRSATALPSSTSSSVTRR